MVEPASDESALRETSRPPNEGEGDVGSELDLTCPGCRTDLGSADLFVVYRVCPACGRHFPIPPRERLALLLDSRSFVETNTALLSLDPLVFHDLLPSPDRLAESHELLSPPGLAHGVITGVGALGGREAVVVVVDMAALGGAIGALAGEKIVLALEQAVADRLPVVVVCAGGSGPERAREGVLGLVQLARIADAAGALRRIGLPLISVLAHPTIGGVYVGLASQADIVVAEPGARIGLGGSDQGHADGAESAETLLRQGLLDAVVERPRLREWLSTLLDLTTNQGKLRSESGAIVAPPANGLSGWRTAQVGRRPDRPSAAELLPRLAPTFVELHGDRVVGDDRALVCGFGRLAGLSVAFIAQDRGAEGGGAIGAAGFRKADRLMRLAGRWEAPLVILLDGSAAGAATAVGGGLGPALGQTLGRSALLPVPLVTAIVGQVGGVGTIALGAGDRMLMMEHALFGIGSAARFPVAPRAADGSSADGEFGHCLSARDCLRLGVVDAVVPEPSGGAQTDPDLAAQLLGQAIATALAELTGVSARRLLADRSRRLRRLGMATPDARAAARRELQDLVDFHDLQRQIARSFQEWRGRLEERYRTAPRRGRSSSRLRRSRLADRIAAIRANVADAVGRAERVRPAGETDENPDGAGGSVDAGKARESTD